MSTVADVTNVYQLRAELDGEVRIESVYGDARNMPEKIVPLMVHEGAEEWEIADADASMSAIPRILNLAAGDDEDARIWAKGAITLTNVKTGRVVRTMPAKDAPAARCAVCDRTLTESEIERLDADIDFVEHYGHTIRREA